MRPHAIYAAAVGAALVLWLGISSGDALAAPIMLALLIAMACLVAAIVATYQWRAQLPALAAAVLSGAVLGLGIAVALQDPTAPLWTASVPFALGGLGACWASYRRGNPAREPSARTADPVGSSLD